MGGDFASLHKKLLIADVSLTAAAVVFCSSGWVFQTQPYHTILGILGLGFAFGLSVAGVWTLVVLPPVGLLEWAIASALFLVLSFSVLIFFLGPMPALLFSIIFPPLYGLGYLGKILSMELRWPFGPR